MDACPLDMLHNTGNEHILPVRDHIHLQLYAREILIHQNRVFNPPCKNGTHVLLGSLAITRDAHVLPTNHIAGPQENRIAQLLSHGKGFIQRVYAPPSWPADAELLQKCVKPCTVLRQVNSVSRSAENTHASAVQKFGERDSRLPAEGHHYSYRLLHLNHAPDVLRCERFKVQPVSRVIISGYSFGIVVDHNNIITHFPKRPHAVDGAIVELDPLTDPDRAGTEHKNHRLAAALKGSCFTFISRKPGIEIGRPGIKLCCAGIHHLIGDGQVILRLRLQSELPELSEKPAVNLRHPVDFLHVRAVFQSIQNRVNPPVILHAPVSRCHRTAYTPQSLCHCHFKIRCDRHHLACGLHLRA